MIILHINTSDNKKTIVSLSGYIKDSLENETTHRSSQILLLMIEELLSKHSVSIDSVSEIQVHSGPGSFTGLRVGISIANALAFGKKISINGKQIGEYVVPEYT